MNSSIGIFDTSSLNFPVTFLLDLSKYGEFSGHSLLSNLSLQKSLYAFSVSISYVMINKSVSVNNSLALSLYIFSKYIYNENRTLMSY